MAHVVMGNQMYGDQFLWHLQNQLSQLSNKVSVLEGALQRSVQETNDRINATKTASDGADLWILQEMNNLRLRIAQQEEIQKEAVDAVDVQAQHLKDKFAEVEDRMSEDARKVHEVVKENKVNHEKLANELGAREAFQAMLEKRMSCIEQRMADSLEKHAQAAEEFAAAVAKTNAMMPSPKEELEDQMNDLILQAEMIKQTANGNNGFDTPRTSCLTSLPASWTSSPEAKLQSHHAEMQERLEYLEGTIGDSADQYAKELSNVHAKMQELHGKLQDEMNSREEKFLHLTDHLREQVSAHKASDQRHASLEERLKCLETLMGDNAETHKRVVEEHSRVWISLAQWSFMRRSFDRPGLENGTFQMDDADFGHPDGNNILEADVSSLDRARPNMSELSNDRPRMGREVDLMEEIKEMYENAFIIEGYQDNDIIRFLAKMGFEESTT